jgi:hypothetical protein
VSPPQGACDEEGFTCGYGDNGGGCGEQCTCEEGEWACAVDPCPPPICPPQPPGPGDTCDDGLSCGYGDGCDSEQCFCTGGYWECEGTSCPPSSCPSEPPGNYQECSQLGSLCDYPIENNVCNTWECECDPSGTWGCYETNCYGVDAGSPGSSSSGGSSSSSGGFGG